MSWQPSARYKTTIVITFLLVVTCVTAVTFYLPRGYRSEGKLFFRLGRENVTLDSSVTLGQEPTVFCRSCARTR